MLSSGSLEERGTALKHILGLLCSARAPSYYLVTRREALLARIDFYTRAMQEKGIIDAELAEQVRAADLSFLERAPIAPRGPFPEHKHIDSTRTYLQRVLGVSSLYDLDRLHLEVDTPIDAPLETDIRDLLTKLHDPEFVDSHGLRGEHLLESSDPKDVAYSVTLFERTPTGNLLRAQADTLDKPFDLNEGMKMELGSTAKLRTVAHYLDLVASLHREFEGMSVEALRTRISTGLDPITLWAAQTMMERPGVDLTDFLSAALERKYSAGTGEVFFTGGGAHTFSNFDSKDNGQILTLREAFRHSTNLVFIRLMRDLVRFHQARLPYRAEGVLNDPDYPTRRDLLQHAADTESTQILARAFRRFRNLSEEELIESILGSRAKSVRPLSMLYAAWNPQATPEELGEWLEKHADPKQDKDAEKMFRSYDPGRLNLLDYAYLLGRHPLQIWCAGRLWKEPGLTWDQLLSSSEDA